MILSVTEKKNPQKPAPVFGEIYKGLHQEYETGVLGEIVFGIKYANSYACPFVYLV